MNVEHIRTLYDYHYWANARLLDTVARAPEDAFLNASLGMAQMRDTLVHAMSAEWNWRSRWQGVSHRQMLAPDDFPTLLALRERWQEEEGRMRAFLAELTDERLQQRIAYNTTDGTPHSNVLWIMMLQVLNHGTQHRSELALLLTELGYSPGNLDFIVYVREQRL
ncbi:MAG TPA: DinB family protein [Roseiflexaceae bacterium]|nr:DinB family protein [Roseiflexaceae bacterium]